MNNGQKVFFSFYNNKKRKQDRGHTRICIYKKHIKKKSLRLSVYEALSMVKRHCLLSKKMKKERIHHPKGIEDEHGLYLYVCRYVCGYDDDDV